MNGFLDTSAQDLTGIWKGKFIDKGNGDVYTYEIQIIQNKNGILKGVSYSYLGDVRLYCTVPIVGYFKTSNSLDKENKMVNLKIGDDVTCDLSSSSLKYSKVGNMEYLTGTYARGVVGEGTMYLHKTDKTDFKKEKFLLNRKPKENLPPQQKKTAPSIKKIDIATKKDSVLKSVKVTVSRKKEELTYSQPNVLKERTNEVVKTIYTDASFITIDLYDNGEIDKDTVTVFHNNRLIVSAQQLGIKPITVKIAINEQDPHHEIILVANNLGDIPPNTALMVVRAGSKRYEVRIVSTEQKNAKIIFEYKK